MWFSDNKTWIIQYQSQETLEPQTLYKNEAETIIIEEGFKTISSNCFYQYTSAKILILPDSVTSLGNNIMYMSSFVEIYIPKNFKSIETSQPFDNQYSLERFTISEDHETLAVYDDALYSKDKKTIYYFPGGKKDKMFSIPQGVETIFPGSIAFNMNLEILVLPPSISNIMEYFCYYLKAIKKIVFIRCESSPELTFDKNGIFYGTNYSYERIEWRNQSYLYEFVNNTHLSVFKNVFCPASSVIVFNDTCFMDNDFIKSISFNRGINVIEGSCFKGNKKLARVSFAETINKVDKKAFECCTSLKRHSSVFYPSSLLPILKPIFSSYVLGLNQITCNNPTRRSTFICTAIYVLTR